MYCGIYNFILKKKENNNKEKLSFSDGYWIVKVVGLSIFYKKKKSCRSEKN